MGATTVSSCHDEVRDALALVADETGIPSGVGDRIRADRRSAFEYSGVRTPDRRRRVAAGFSFTAQADGVVLSTWDGIWNLTSSGDVLFAVLDHYRRRIAATADEVFWQTARGWIDRIDNWAHADDLARIYSYALAAHPALVYPVLQGWSADDNVWRRRISMVSLIHYSGKNAVFMPVAPVLELVANCVADQRDDISKAVGWVLRETMAAYPDEVISFLDEHGAQMAPRAVRRATEKLPPGQRDSIRASLRNSLR